MAIDTTIGNGAPGIASMQTESFASAAEPRYGEGVPTTTPHLVTAGADLDLPLYSVISISAAGVIALAKANAAAGYAALALTFSGVGTAADTITIDGKVYTLRAAVDETANEVLIGGTAAETAANLNAAINGAAAGSGVTYGSDTVAQTRVSSSVSGAVVTVTANDPGDEGNAIAVSESGTGASWAGGGTVLAGGDDDMELKPYGILAAPLVLLNAASTHVPLYREGYWDMNSLNWDATFIDDEMKRHAFEGSVSPNIFIGKKKFSNADIPV